MSVIHISCLRISKHEGPHRMVYLDSFPETDQHARGRTGLMEG